MSDAVRALEVTEASFQNEVVVRSYQMSVLVDFWAPWCAPCRALMPVLDRAVSAYAGKVALAKVNTDEQQALASAFGVRSLPTLKLFRNGTPVEELMGVQPEARIRAMIDAHVERASDQQRAAAAEARASGDLGRAVQLLSEALDADPENLKIHPELVDLLLDAGDLEAAAAVLARVPPGSKIDAQLDALRARLRLARRSAESGSDTQALRSAVENDPGDCGARFDLACALTATGDYESALEELLEVLRINRAYKSNAARKAMLDIFKLLGDGDPIVSRYRGRLASALH